MQPISPENSKIGEMGKHCTEMHKLKELLNKFKTIKVRKSIRLNKLNKYTVEERTYSYIFMSIIYFKSVCKTLPSKQKRSKIYFIILKRCSNDYRGNFLLHGTCKIYASIFSL